MEQNEEKRDLSEVFDSNTSTLVISKEFQDKDDQDTKLSHELHRISAACRYPHDLDLLITLATAPGGLVNDEVRKVACKSFFAIAENAPIFRHSLLLRAYSAWLQKRGVRAHRLCSVLAELPTPQR